MKPSISPYERRDEKPEFLEELNRREKQTRIVGFLIMIVLTLGIVFLLADWIHSPEKAEASPIVDDKEICAKALTYYLEGYPEIADYCKDLAARKL